MSRRLPAPSEEVIDGVTLSFHQCRVLPDTALVLRDVVKEAERLWIATLGPEGYARLRSSPAGEAFFTGRVRIEEVPPEREMLAVWLPFPAGFRRRIRPQLIDQVEVPPGGPRPAPGIS